jgi:GTP 3',8-cyclase
MLDRYKREITYLRISVTDRCNLRCYYCMPEKDPAMLKHSDILSFEEIQQVVAAVVPMGITKIRLTGGEPLVRKDIIKLVSMIAGVEGVHDLAMTTNATLLEKFARPLAKAGLQRINISLDTTDADKFRLITRGGDINKVYRGIAAAKDAGLHPVKINCVVKGDDRQDAEEVKAFGLREGLDVRFISEMDLQGGHFSVVEGGSGGDCKHCNRLRLTSNGKIKPCLFSDLEYDIRELGIKKAIGLALEHKPVKGTVNMMNAFHNIGG